MVPKYTPNVQSLSALSPAPRLQREAGYTAGKTEHFASGTGSYLQPCCEKSRLPARCESCVHAFSRTCRCSGLTTGLGSSSLSLQQLARILRCRRVAVARTAVIGVLAHAQSLGAWHFVFVGRGMCDVLGIFSLLGCSVGMERTTGDKRNKTFTANS